MLAPGRHEEVVMSAGTETAETAVLDVRGVQWASEKSVVEAVLGRRPGVQSVSANPVAQTATVTYDPGRTSVAELSGWIRDCGYHCAGQSVPLHVCDPMTVPADPAGAQSGQREGHRHHAATALAAP